MYAQIISQHIQDIFLDFVRLSSVKKIRRRNSFDPYPPDIVKYRNLRPPSPPKKVRRLLWTAPYGIYV